MIELTIDADAAGKRLDRYLAGRFEDLGVGRINSQLRRRGITVNRKKVHADHRLEQGDVVRLYCEAVPRRIAGETIEEYRAAYRGLNESIGILYEDADVLIADKAAGVLSQRARPSDMSVNEWLIGLLLERGELRADTLGTFRPGVCNRLDRNTSGCIICSKTLAGARGMSTLISKGQVGKFYSALVYGDVRTPGELNGSLVKDAHTNTVTVDAGEAVLQDGARKVRLTYRPVAHMSGMTLLEVRLHTGKTHQIRAQLSAAGYPIVGDPKYGDRERDRGRVRGQRLHCTRLVFPEDKSLGELMGREIVSPIPISWGVEVRAI